MKEEIIIKENSTKWALITSGNYSQKIIGSKLKEWIEGTQLFDAIKRHAGTGLIIESLPYDFQLKLDGISNIEKAEDLPIELIQNFYENSPFYTDNTFTQKQINLNNESTSQENLW